MDVLSGKLISSDDELGKGFIMNSRNYIMKFPKMLLGIVVSPLLQLEYHFSAILVSCKPEDLGYDAPTENPVTLRRGDSW